MIYLLFYYFKHKQMDCNNAIYHVPTWRFNCVTVINNKNDAITKLLPMFEDR